MATIPFLPDPHEPEEVRAQRQRDVYLSLAEHTDAAEPVARWLVYGPASLTTEAERDELAWSMLLDDQRPSDADKAEARDLLLRMGYDPADVALIFPDA